MSSYAQARGYRDGRGTDLRHAPSGPQPICTKLQMTGGSADRGPRPRRPAPGLGVGKPRGEARPHAEDLHDGRHLVAHGPHAHPERLGDPLVADVAAEQFQHPVLPVGERLQLRRRPDAGRGRVHHRVPVGPGGVERGRRGEAQDRAAALPLRAVHEDLAAVDQPHLHRRVAEVVHAVRFAGEQRPRGGVGAVVVEDADHLQAFGHPGAVVRQALAQLRTGGGRARREQVPPLARRPHHPGRERVAGGEHPRTGHGPAGLQRRHRGAPPALQFDHRVEHRLTPLAVGGVGPRQLRTVLPCQQV